MQVKVLGTLAMVDDGEADWKMIVIGGIVGLGQGK
jgi:inorganic pyrophosphatase